MSSAYSYNDISILTVLIYIHIQISMDSLFTTAMVWLYMLCINDYIQHQKGNKNNNNNNIKYFVISIIILILTK